MSALVFTKTGDVWVSEVTVNSDFNLHVEKEDSGELRVYQSGVTDGQYCPVFNGRFSRYQNVVDCDFSALVYPKYIKVMSDVEPSVGVITES